MNKSKRGITLIALVITIIVLLILAAISLTMLTGDNSILKRAVDAKERTIVAGEKEQIQLEVMNSYETNGSLLIGTLNTNIKTHISDVVTDDATSFPLTITYIATGNSYLVEENGSIAEPVVVDGSSSDWQLNDEKDTIIAYIGGAIIGDTIIVPNYVDGNKVIKLGNGSTPVFESNQNLTQGKKLEITRGIEEIGANAFSSGGGFTGDLILPNGMKIIGNYAFAGDTGFTGNLTIPDSATKIGLGAFAGCTNFSKDLYIGKNIQYIDDNAFGGIGVTNGFNNIEIQMKEIPERLFQGSLKGNALKIGNNVEKIGQQAFANCSNFNGSLYIGKNLSTIGANVFSQTPFENIEVNAINIPNYLFDGCSMIKGTLSIGKNVETIGDDAFRNCSELTGSIIIPDSVTQIGEFSFGSCSGFTGNITLGKNLKKIGRSAFWNCINLTGSLTIEDNVEIIDDCAFSECKNLNGTLILGKKVQSIGTEAFRRCGFTGNLNIPNSVTSIESYAFELCSNLNGNLVLSNNITEIATGTFKYCKFTGTVNIPEGVTYIGQEAFYDCSSLTSIIIPSTITTIDGEAFKNVNNIINNSAYTTNSPWGAKSIGE